MENHGDYAIGWGCDMDFDRFLMLLIMGLMTFSVISLLVLCHLDLL